MITSKLQELKLHTRDIIKSYFSHLEKWVIVPPECIYNFDETNVLDDPGAKTVICRRGRNRVERKVNHLKTSISFMLCGTAAGEFIPPMVVYKSEHCYENWTIGGYNNMVYDCTTNRWFDSRTFQTWFFKQFIPSIRKHQGKQVVLIGDNLGSHFSPKLSMHAWKITSFSSASPQIPLIYASLSMLLFFVLQK